MREARAKMGPTQRYIESVAQWHVSRQTRDFAVMLAPRRVGRLLCTQLTRTRKQQWTICCPLDLTSIRRTG
jgi:hypothetical protein